MTKNIRQQAPLQLLCTLLLCFSISACDNANTPETSAEQPTQQQVITLSTDNINAYAQQLASDYLSRQASLLAAFHEAKSKDDAYSFVQFRNYQWTEDYIARKQQYVAVLEHNQAILDAHPAKNLFMAYQNLIYIGLELKNGLLDDDEAMQTKALADAEHDKQLVQGIALQLQAPAHPIITN